MGVAKQKMIRLCTLGTLDLRGSDGREIRAVLTQPKRLALLAYLALAKPRSFHRRDALLGLFWPELDEEHARDALNQSVYFLRRALGKDVVVSRGRDELGVNALRLWCDVIAFEEALEGEDLENALELYEGDLLHGFHLSQAFEWEQWLEAERARLRARAAAGAWQLAEQAAETGYSGDVARWGKRSLTLAPADESRLRLLMALLDDLGDRAAAVRLYDEAEAWITRELDVEPSPESREMVERMRLRERRAPGVPEAGSPPRQDVRSLAANDPADAALTDPRFPEEHSAPGEAHASRRRTRRILFAVATLMGTIAVANLIWPHSTAVSSSASTDAEEEYLRGRHLLSKLDGSSFSRARSHFERALDLDPTHARAWSGLSTAYNQLSSMMALSADEAYPRARAAAERALEIDPQLGEAHGALAMALTMYYWDTDRAERHFQQAIALEPGSARIRRHYASHLRNLGRFDEALMQIRASSELDPLFTFAHAEEGVILYLAGRYEEAIDCFRTFLRVHPDHTHVHMFIAMARAQKGAFEDALAALMVADPQQTKPDAVAYRGFIYGLMGLPEQTERVLEKLDSLADAKEPISPFHHAIVHVGLGEYDRAIDLLEEAADHPSWHMRLLKVEPTLAPLRGNQRFRTLLAKVGLG